MGDQINQDLKGFGAQGHWLLCPPQHGVGQIEPKGFKVPLHWSSPLQPRNAQASRDEIAFDGQFDRNLTAI
jgi:hypothetical protein